MLSAPTSRRPDAAAPVFAALGDPLRLGIIRRLCEGGPVTTLELGRESAAMTRQGITRHLQVLEGAGVIESFRDGRDRRWRLNFAEIAALRDDLAILSALWDARLERLRALVEDATSG